MRLIRSILKRTAHRRMSRRFPGLDPATLSRRSDTAVIFGSGPSINQITAEQWSAFAKHDTFGLNFWLLHPFVPRFYFLEGFRDTSERDYFKAELLRRADEYRDVTWLLQAAELEHYLGGAAKVFDLFPWAGKPALVWLQYRRALVPKEMDFQRRHFEALPAGIGDEHPKGFGSVTLALSVAYAMGYTTIVLAGIDLDTPGYFWQQGEGRHSEFRRAGGGVAQLHKTASHDKYHPVQDYILAFNRLVLEPEGRKLMLANPTGLLASELSVHSSAFPEAAR
ncbi:MAG: hypothetical protein L6Q71_08555 [Planctomycetes bacterium]|nr:hypothetical protein [Planctomycetota bacterium]NUQ35747.1 hypothetical protein [Planctomycetaceae bacterium]